MRCRRVSTTLSTILLAAALPAAAQTDASQPAAAQPDIAPAQAPTALDSIAVEPLRDAWVSTAVAPPEATRLDPIVVTGTRTAHRLSDAPIEVQLISEADIRRSGARDLGELLEREGGVYATRVAGRGSSIELQGLSSEHVLILVDGRRMIGRVNGAIDLSRLRVDAIQRVEIVKGPSSALYGADALGGVVNVITRRGGADSGGNVTVRADTERNREILGHAGWTLGPLDGHSSGGWFRIAPYDLDASTPATDGIDGDSRFVSTEADWWLSESASLGLSGAYSLDDSSRIDGGLAGRSADTRKRIEEVRVGIAPRVALGTETELRGDLYYNRYFDQFLQRNRTDGSVSIDEETLDELFVAAAQLEHRLDDHRLLLGAEAQFEQLNADRLDQKGERDRQSLFGQDEWNPPWRDGRLVLVPGLRYDRDSQFGDQLSPKLAARYALSPELTLRAGYGRGYRAPDFKQLLLRFDNPSIGYRVEGNPDLQPERSTGFNAGLIWQPASGAIYSLGAYHNRVSDLIEIVQIESGPPILFSYRNIANARLTGIDAQGQWKLTPSLELQLGYGWLHSRDQATGESLSGRAEHRGNAKLRYEQPDYALQLRGVCIGERRFTTDVDTGGPPGAAGTADPYALFDLRAEWTRWTRFTLAAGIDNLFDKGDPDFLPIAPRAAYLELQWNFR